MLDMHRKELARREPRLVEILVQHMDSSSLKVQSEAAFALHNLACDGECQSPTPRDILLTTTTDNYQLEIVKANGLNPLLRLLQSPHHDSIYAAASCVSNLTLQPTNHSPIIDAGFLQPLVALLAFKDNEKTQLRAAGTLRNLSTSPGINRQAVVNAGAVQSIKELILEMPMRIQIPMTRCIEDLSKSGMGPPFDRLL